MSDDFIPFLCVLLLNIKIGWRPNRKWPFQANKFDADLKLAANLCKHVDVEIQFDCDDAWEQFTSRFVFECNYTFVRMTLLLVFLSLLLLWIRMDWIYYTHQNSAQCYFTGFTSHFLGKIISLRRSILLSICFSLSPSFYLSVWHIGLPIVCTSTERIYIIHGLYWLRLSLFRRNIPAISVNVYASYWMHSQVFNIRYGCHMRVKSHSKTLFAQQKYRTSKSGI